MSEKNISVSELSRRLNLSRAAINNYSNTETFQVDVFDKIVVALGVSPEYFLNYNIPDQPLKTIPEDPNGKEIPFFNQEVYGTISPVLDDYITMQPYAIKKIPMFMSADGAVQVKGHSMKGWFY